MAKIKSPLRYPGGKSKALKSLEPLFPAFKEFREPFFGGGSVSLSQIQSYPKLKYKANDLNYELYCFWEQLKLNAKELISDIQNIKDTITNGRELYSLLLERRNSALSDIERAVDFFVLNRITFSGLADSGGYSDESFKKRFTQSSIDRLSPVGTLIAAVDFTCSDYAELCISDGDDVFVFLDPPYYSATQSRLYGKDGYLHLSFDHKRLYAVLKDSPHKWLMTYDNCEYIKELYKDFFIKEWSHQYSMNNYKSPNDEEKKNIPRSKELLISNF